MTVSTGSIGRADRYATAARHGHLR